MNEKSENSLHYNDNSNQYTDIVIGNTLFEAVNSVSGISMNDMSLPSALRDAWAGAPMMPTISTCNEEALSAT